ncbi:MAG: ABC transporter ATP-binding protein [Methylobacteriaceae bacterium]|nr:ABC transporter ATP-binding protein [Methylobacteriaceae bacterium]
MSGKGYNEEQGRAPGWGERGTAGAVIASELAFDSVSHSYGAGLAVDGVTLDVRPAEVVCLVGPSGCGKTTLLRLAAGIERPSAGRILIDRREVSGPAGHVPPERRGVGLMFQDYALFPHLSILDNVRFGLQAMAEPARSDLAERSLARVGLAGYGKDFPHMLSGGEQQRVALARALAPRPGVLLMDEPFSNLDGRMRDEVREGALAVIRETRATAVIVTHDPEEALRVADRIVLMRAGQIEQAGRGEELYLRPRSLFAARFFCELNEARGKAQGGFVDTPLGRFHAPERARDGQTVIVCVRPRGVLLGRAGRSGAPGRVLERRFLGDVDLYAVIVDGLPRPLICRARGSRAGDADFSPGDEVRVSLAPEDVLVFAATGA